MTLLLPDGLVTEELIDLARAEARTDVQQRCLDELKAQLVQRVMAAPAADVYELAGIHRELLR